MDYVFSSKLQTALPLNTNVIVSNNHIGKIKKIEIRENEFHVMLNLYIRGKNNITSSIDDNLYASTLNPLVEGVEEVAVSPNNIWVKADQIIDLAFIFGYSTFTSDWCCGHIGMKNLFFIRLCINNNREFSLIEKFESFPSDSYAEEIWSSLTNLRLLHDKIMSRESSFQSNHQIRHMVTTKSFWNYFKYKFIYYNVTVSVGKGRYYRNVYSNNLNRYSSDARRSSVEFIDVSSISDFQVLTNILGISFFSSLKCKNPGAKIREVQARVHDSFNSFDLSNDTNRIRYKFEYTTKAMVTLKCCIKRFSSTGIIRDNQNRLLGNNIEKTNVGDEFEYDNVLFSIVQFMIIDNQEFVEAIAIEYLDQNIISRGNYRIGCSYNLNSNIYFAFNN